MLYKILALANFFVCPTVLLIFSVLISLLVYAKDIQPLSVFPNPLLSANIVTIEPFAYPPILEYDVLAPVLIFKPPFAVILT